MASPVGDAQVTKAVAVSVRRGGEVNYVEMIEMNEEMKFEERRETCL
jgi:hypothetical protein